MGAAFHRGESKQDYGTPADFIAAVEERFGKLDFDLAANEHNRKAERWLGPGSPICKDTLSLDPKTFFSDVWGDNPPKNCWLNPPFDNIAPWAKWCADSVNGRSTLLTSRILFLVPASVGSNWFANHVHNWARTKFLNGRLSFDGKHPYPKDCMLCIYGPLELDPPNWPYDVWSWK